MTGEQRTEFDAALAQPLLGVETVLARSPEVAASIAQDEMRLFMAASADGLG